MSSGNSILGGTAITGLSSEMGAIIRGAGERRGLGILGATTRGQLTAILTSLGTTVAWHQPGAGITGTLNASNWANWSLGSAGTNGDLAQASGAAQPVYLPFTGDKYLSQYGVDQASNVSTPNTSAYDALGDYTVIAKVAENNWTNPAGVRTIIAKNSGGLDRTFSLIVFTDGTLGAEISDTGADKTTFSSAATGFSAGAIGYLAYTRKSSDGALKFYTSSDGLTWAQLGTTKTGVTGALYTNTAPIYVGAASGGIVETNAGKIYWTKVYTGIVADLATGAGGTLIGNFNAADFAETSTNGATAVSSTTGETWTLNNAVVAMPAAIIGTPTIAADEVATWMRATYTANQPLTYYLVGIDQVWNAGKYIADGTTANKLGLSKTTGTPKISMNAGTAGADDANFSLRARHVLTLVENAASSSIQVDGNAATACSINTGNPGGLTIGADGGTPTAGSFGGFWFNEIIVNAGADSAGTQAQIQSLLKSLYGTP